MKKVEWQKLLHDNILNEEIHGDKGDQWFESKKGTRLKVRAVPKSDKIPTSMDDLRISSNNPRFGIDIGKDELKQLLKDLTDAKKVLGW